MWEAFLIQMNEFDRFLNFELRQLLDPVVASRAPQRVRPKGGSGSPLLVVVTAPIELVAEALPVVEPVVPFQPAQLLP